MLKYVFIKKSKISNSKKLISSLSNSIQCYVPRRTFNQWKILIFQEPVPVILYFLKIGPKFFITFEFLKGYGFARNFPDFQSLDASSSVKCKNYFWGNICRFLVFEFLQMTKFVISNVKNNKIETMQFQIFWQHKKVPFWFAAFAIFMSQKDSCSPEVFLVGKKKSLLFHMIYSDNAYCAIFESEIQT